MTDETGDRPGGRPERPLPARRASEDAVPTRPVERFTAPRQVRAIAGLTPERAARIVRQSGDARWVAFLGLVIVALFVIVYYFYQLFGIPFISPTPLSSAQAGLQQVTAVERGYNLYQANCARCHGPNGEGGVGPVLNDQMKLFAHLNEQYLENVLEVGGRYVCGNPKSLMPAWAEPAGPLNYVQIEDLIAFIRAPNTQDFDRRDPELNEPVLDAEGNVITFKGWRDPAFKPPAEATPVPACHSGTVGGASPTPQATLPTAATVVDLTAEGIAFEPLALTVPAGEAFGIKLIQNDTGVGGHDVDIRQERGSAKLVDNPVLLEPGEQTFTIGALEPGTYNFFCSVHDIDQMNGTLTVE